MTDIITGAAVKPSCAPASHCLPTDRSATWQVERVPFGTTAVAAVRLRHPEYATNPEQGFFGGHLGGANPMTGFDTSTVVDPVPGSQM